MSKKTVQRFDFAEMREPVVTAEGYLKADAYVTRSGIFEYQMYDGTIRREFRPEEEVFLQESLDTLKEIPVTNDHPWDFVNSENSKDYSVGMTNDSVVRDGDFVALGLTVLQKNAVHDIVVMKKQEMSCGYTCEVWDQKGVWNGQEYDAVQKNIRYNHVAIVDQGRAGPDVKIKIDSAFMVVKKDGGSFGDSKKDESQKVAKNKGKESKMTVKFKIDSKEFEVSDEATANEITSKIDSQKQEIEALKKSNSELEAKKDALLADVEKAKAEAPKREDVMAEAKARIELEGFAKNVLGDEAKLDSTDIELKTQIVKSQKPNVSLEGKSDDYVAAMFDIAKEEFAASKEDKSNVQAAFKDKAENASNKEDSIHDVYQKNNVLNKNFTKKSA